LKKKVHPGENVGYAYAGNPRAKLVLVACRKCHIFVRIFCLFLSEQEK